MERLVWFFRSSESLELLELLLRPLLVGLALYHFNYVFILLRILLKKLGLLQDDGRLPAELRPEALVALPTLLGKRADLEGLKRAVQSAMANGYPGPLTIAAAIDHATQAPELCNELEVWVRSLDLPASTRIVVSRTPNREGKAMALEHAVGEIKAQVERGELARFPPVFFSMDADSELAPGTLERMAACLHRRSRITGQRPMIITSNVCVAPAHYWKGWRHFVTVPGQLALQVAREYMTSISVGRVNNKPLPVTTVSGALYCTWSELYLHAPRYAGFIRTLRLRDWLAWWLGLPPPSFAARKAPPLPEGMIGPGDDTFVTWLAMCARWRGDRIDLELPRTPLHALTQGLREYFFRNVGYDPEAKIYTSTPTTIRGLFRQRIRWNTSRPWLVQRFGPLLFFKWHVAAAVVSNAVILLGVHLFILVSLFLLPFVEQPKNWLGLLVLAGATALLIRTAATLLALLQVDGLRRSWHTLLALPLSGIYHFVFNILATLVGLTEDLLLFGVNTGFAPESTLIRSRVGRVAIAYRLRRALFLAVRAVRYGDVPLGWFWFGWEETPWTPNGYRGWTDKTTRVRPVDFRPAGRPPGSWVKTPPSPRAEPAPFAPPREVAGGLSQRKRLGG